MVSWWIDNTDIFNKLVKTQVANKKLSIKNIFTHISFSNSKQNVNMIGCVSLSMNLSSKK